MTERKRQRQFGYVRKLPSGRWQASYLGADGRRRSAESTFPAKADASAWLARMQTELADGTWRPPEPARETFGSYGRRWLDSRPDLRPSTAERYERLWRLWLEPTFGKVPLGKLAAEDWRTWFTGCQASHPGSTQPAAAYRLARAMLHTAVDDGLLRANPCRVKGASADQAQERPVAMPDEVLRIADAIGDRERALVLVAAWCCLRFGELAGLRRSRINLMHRTIRVEENAVELSDGRTVFGPPKTDAGRRTVPIPAELVPVLEHHLDPYVPSAPTALVFTSPGQPRSARSKAADEADGTPLRRTKFRGRWVKACERAGLPALHFHDLRGSGATWAGQAGATLAELMALLGHTTPDMAMRYQHATHDRLQALAAKVGQLFVVGATDERPAVTSLRSG